MYPAVLFKWEGGGVELTCLINEFVLSGFIKPDRGKRERERGLEQNGTTHFAMSLSVIFLPSFIKALFLIAEYSRAVPI